MIKKQFEKSKYADVELAFERDGKKYYYLRVNPVEVGDSISAIESLVAHYPTRDDFSELYSKWLELAKTAKLYEVEQYAKSSEVKDFAINDVHGWEDSNDRSSISKAASDKKAAGRDTYNLHHGGVSFSTTPDMVVDIIARVEVYASDCFDVTEAHKSAVTDLTDINEVENYVVTSNYPEKVSFQL